MTNEINALVRDLTQVVPKPKSEARRMLDAFEKNVRTKAIKECIRNLEKGIVQYAKDAYPDRETELQLDTMKAVVKALKVLLPQEL